MIKLKDKLFFKMSTIFRFSVKGEKVKVKVKVKGEDNVHLTGF